MSGRLVRVVGALAEAEGLPGAGLHELVRVGAAGLLGEVLRVRDGRVTMQVFEETIGLEIGEPVVRLGAPLSIELGPGLLGATLDGIGRPLHALAASDGDRLRSSTQAKTLDRAARHRFVPALAPGVEVGPGDVLGEVEERPGFRHAILVPPGVFGRLAELRAGEFTVDDPIGGLADGTPLRLHHSWPVRRPRPSAARTKGDRPFLTGQRIFDFLFPVARGGTALVPGGFGTGKTVIEQSLAKYGDADVVVYIGCGERGNEMAEVLNELGELVDPKTGRRLVDRTVLIVNTSNMPVAAREASIDLGLTIAEYFRDMGKSVAVLADSLSRWAEALREIAARLEEMPGEEGYPTHLGSRTAKLHERAGEIRCLGAPERTGSVTLISAVSPPGGDFSEPVTQACTRVAGAMWALDPELAHQRQFPAVDWRQSYSAYEPSLERWFAAEIDPAWSELRRRTLEILQRDAELREIALVVGADALEDADRLRLEAAALIRETVIGQSALDPNDASSPPEKTLAIAKAALEVHDRGLRRVAAGREADLGPARRALIALRDAALADREARAAALDRALAALEGRPG